MGGKSKATQKTSKGIQTSSKITMGDLADNDKRYLEAVQNGDMRTAAAIAHNSGFEKLPDGRLAGYRVVPLKTEATEAKKYFDNRFFQDVISDFATELANIEQGSRVYNFNLDHFTPEGAIHFFDIHKFPSDEQFEQLRNEGTLESVLEAREQLKAELLPGLQNFFKDSLIFRGMNEDVAEGVAEMSIEVVPLLYECNEFMQELEQIASNTDINDSAQDLRLLKSKYHTVEDFNAGKYSNPKTPEWAKDKDFALGVGQVVNSQQATRINSHPPKDRIRSRNLFPERNIVQKVAFEANDNNKIKKVVNDLVDVWNDFDTNTSHVADVKDYEVLENEVVPQNQTAEKSQIAPVAYDEEGNIIPPSERFVTADTIQAQKKSSRGIGGSSKMAAANIPPSQIKPDSISSVAKGNVDSPTFQKNAQARSMTPDEWGQALTKVEEEMFTLDANNNFTMSDQEFNDRIGDMVVQNMKDQNATNMTGVVKTLPNTGKIIVIGDTHEQTDNIIHILNDIQSNPETNLDLNPDTKIVFLGDLLSGSKAGDPNALVADRQTQNQTGEVSNRLMTLLMAKYPDQIHSIMGNHDLGILIGDKYVQDQTYKLPEYGKADIDAIQQDPSLSDAEKQRKINMIKNYTENREMMLTDAQSSHPRATLSASNEQHIVDKLKQTPGVIIVGDKTKGEKVRMFVHSPPTANLDNLDNFKNNTYDNYLDNPIATLFDHMVRSPGATDTATMRAALNKLGVDEVYFGHLAPKTMEQAITNNHFKKTDGVNSPVGQNDGGGNYVDSQTRTERSGYMVIDLNQDKSTTRLMPGAIGQNSNNPAAQRTTNTAKTAKTSTPLSKFNFLTADMLDPNRVAKKPTNF